MLLFSIWQKHQGFWAGGAFPVAVEGAACLSVSVANGALIDGHAKW